MAYSTQRAVSNGSLGQLALAIDYFDRSEISVYFNGIISLPGSGKWSWVGTTDKTITFTPAVANGVEVMIQRSTQIGEPLHQYTKGAQFIAETLDENFKQVLRIAQEAREGSGAADVYNDLDFHGFRVKNIGTAVVDTDAVSLGQYKADAAGASVAKTAAQTAASNAATSESNALASKNAAATSATNAGTSETNALGYKNAAATSAQNASTSEGNAAGSATAANTSAGNASTSATAANNWATSLTTFTGSGGLFGARKYANDAATSAASVVRNGSGGVAGLTGFLIDLFNAAGTIKSALASVATAARTWTFPDKSGTVAMTSDITDATISTVNGGPLAGFRNLLNNGAMLVQQRGNLGNVGGATLMDRWLLNVGGSAPSVTAFFGQNFLPAGGACNVLRVNGAAGNTDSNIEQRIESGNIRHLAGQVVTLSYWFYQDTGVTKNIRSSAAYPNSVDNYSASTPIASSGTVAVPSATWTKITWAFTLPAGAANGLRVTLAEAVGAIGAGQSYSIGDAQLEPGPVATPFERRPYPLELLMCQRYYQVLSPTPEYAAGSTTDARYVYRPYLVPMRAVPTATLSSSANVCWNQSGVDFTPSIFDFNSVGTQSCSIRVVSNGTNYPAGLKNYLIFLNAEL